MASARILSSSDDALEWAQKDNRRFLHAVYRVGDLDRTIKFYTENFGMQLLRKKDFPELKLTNAVLGYGPEDSHFVADVTYYYGIDKYDIGTYFSHFGIATQDAYKVAEKVRESGGVITREVGTMGGGQQIFGFVLDPNGYSFELLQRGPTPEPLCQVCYQVTDINLSIKFYEKALGMKVLQSYDSPQQGFAIAMMGYGEDQTQTTVIELRYDYNATGYTKGNAYEELVISTDDAFKSAEAVKLVIQELGGQIISAPLPGSNIKMVVFVDPDGFKTVLMDNKDFLEELKRKQ